MTFTTERGQRYKMRFYDAVSYSKDYGLDSIRSLLWKDYPRSNRGTLFRFLNYSSDEKIENFLKTQTEKGIEEKKGNEEIVCTLTSYPGRIEKTFITVEALLRQTKKPNRICLYLIKKEFKGKKLPKTLILQMNRGLEIRWVDDNIRSFAKLVPALKDFPNAVLVTFDDDIFYRFDSLEALYNAHKYYPKDIIALGAQPMEHNKKNELIPYNAWKSFRSTPHNQVSNQQIQIGSQGCLYPVKSLSPHVLDKTISMALAPKQDDVWFYAMALLNDTKIRKIGNITSQEFETEQESAAPPLWTINRKTDFSEHSPNDYALHKVLSYYDLYKKIEAKPCVHCQ